MFVCGVYQSQVNRILRRFDLDLTRHGKNLEAFPWQVLGCICNDQPVPLLFEKMGSSVGGNSTVGFWHFRWFHFVDLHTWLSHNHHRQSCAQPPPHALFSAGSGLHIPLSYQPENWEQPLRHWPDSPTQPNPTPPMVIFRTPCSWYGTLPKPIMRVAYSLVSSGAGHATYPSPCTSAASPY